MFSLSVFVICPFSYISLSRSIFFLSLFCSLSFSFNSSLSLSLSLSVHVLSLYLRPSFSLQTFSQPARTVQATSGFPLIFRRFPKKREKEDWREKEKKKCEKHENSLYVQKPFFWLCNSFEKKTLKTFFLQPKKKKIIESFRFHSSLSKLKRFVEKEIMLIDP
jgi:hypothetical protein